MRIGRLVSCSGEDDLTGASCSAGMVHLLSTETYIPAYYFSCLGEQVFDGSAQPTLMAVDDDRLQAGSDGIGQVIVERRARKLDSPGENDQFNLVEGELSDCFGRSESFILNSDQIRYGAGTNASFSVTETKNICRSGCDHLVQGIGGEADFVAGEVDFVE